MRLLAPAKINLHLRVGPPRPDGFHPLLSWMCTAGLFDELEFQANPSGRIELECDDPAIPLDGRNLIVQAALALRPAGQPGARIKLTKRIPAGGGLAGGSSDAACALMGLNQLWNLGLLPEQLRPTGARLGSDVSFFFFGPSSICRGVGDQVVPMAAPAARWALLILPPFAMPTAQVYQRFDRMKLGRRDAIEAAPDFSAWATLAAAALLTHLVNDLEAAAFDLNPALGRLQSQWQEQLGRPVRLSGSGSTLFTLYDSAAQAHAAASAAGTSQSLRVVEIAPA
jgi:4-diphosphocytidyl-2-C-methyl-D-erythritol kinase